MINQQGLEWCGQAYTVPVKKLVMFAVMNAIIEVGHKPMEEYLKNWNKGKRLEPLRQNMIKN